jgi:hypothetical protein
MSTTLIEAQSIWIDRNTPYDDSAARGEIEFDVRPNGTVVLTWQEWDWQDREVRRSHVYTGTMVDLTHEFYAIKEGG